MPGPDGLLTHCASPRGEKAGWRVCWGPRRIAEKPVPGTFVEQRVAAISEVATPFAGARSSHTLDHDFSDSRFAASISARAIPVFKALAAWGVQE